MASRHNHSETQTRDDTWSDELDGLSSSGERRLGRLRILYHLNLDRIGHLSHPLSEDVWHAIGRSRPDFIPVASDGFVQPLLDPTVSRNQIRLRWLPSHGVFEVEPCADAKRRAHVARVTEHGVLSPLRLLTSATQLPPGSVIAIGSRVLLGLELASTAPAPDTDRLGFVGESDLMWRLRKDIQEIATFGRPVLVLGQTGVGKELVARAIHAQSPRQDQPFEVVNCSALPEHLVESLLFGHRKGAFTGAEADRVGVFQTAHRGSLFLDELGEMPSLVQPKLLRTLQDGKVMAIGSPKREAVDVRFIAATNREPEVEIASGKLREDLYYRLSGHIIRVPPLSARRFDVPELFVHALRVLRAEHTELSWLWEGARRWSRTIPQSFFVDLLNSDLKGNVRQLENIAERLARLNLRGPGFHAPALPVHAVAQEPLAHASAVSPPSPSVSPTPGLSEISQALELAPKTVAKLFGASDLERLLGAVEGQSTQIRTHHFRDAASRRLYKLLTQHDFKQRSVVSMLGISPSTLIKMMRSFDLPRAIDLELSTIQDALLQFDGDIESSARHLKVSPHGLKKRLAQLNLKHSFP